MRQPHTARETVRDVPATPARRGSRRRQRTLTALVVGGLAVALSGCSATDASEWRRLALPIGASDRVEDMFALWVGAWIAVLVTFVLVFGLIVYAMVKYRQRSEDEIPSQVRYNLPIEVLYTVAPLIVVAVFFFHTVETQNSMLKRVETPDHTIEVVGFKWQWAFNYEEEQAVDGETVHDIGTPAEPTELYLPVGESVRFDLRSPDVIHSFWIPEFYFKMDVVPGRANSFDLTPTREGTFTGRCAELCGMYHSRMIFTVNVVSPQEYEQHLRELEAAGQTGSLRGGAGADTIDGLEQENGAD